MTSTPQKPASPFQMPADGWKAAAKRSWAEAGKDNVGLVSAGVAFYGFGAIVPLLGALVLSYGLVADSKTVIANVQALTGVLPRDAAQLIGQQLMAIVQTSGGKKGLGLAVALLLALFGARSGAGAVVTALNIAYEEQEKRNFLWLNLLNIGITAAGILVAVLAMTATAVLAKLEALIPGAPGVVLVVSKIVTYVLLWIVGSLGAAALYRFGPSRRKARWTWLSPGSVLASTGWILLTLGFGFYVSEFGNYNATYGSLGAVVVLLTWLYLSSYILVFGAELNSELEHQTAADTTAGAPQPLGERGAWAADHVAERAPDRPAAALPARTLALAAGSPIATYAAGRLGAHLGGATAGRASTVLAAAGLSQLRRRGRAKAGLGLLAAAAALSWWRRRA